MASIQAEIHSCYGSLVYGTWYTALSGYKVYLYGRADSSRILNDELVGLGYLPCSCILGSGIYTDLGAGCIPAGCQSHTSPHTGNVSPRWRDF